MTKKKTGFYNFLAVLFALTFALAIVLSVSYIMYEIAKAAVALAPDTIQHHTK